MKNVLKSLVLVCLAVAIAMPLAAEDDAKKKRKKKDGAKGQQSALATFVKQLGENVDLTAEQTGKIKELQDAAQPKLAEANKVIGPKRKEIAAARKKAADDGLKGKEAQAAAEAGLTADEKAAFAATRTITQDFKKAVAALLTPEQQGKAGLKPGGDKKKIKKNAA